MNVARESRRSRIPGAPPRVRRLPRAETRALILAAARSIFMAKGFQAATLDEIADCAGFSKGAVYSNFRGKDDLVLTLLENERERRLKSGDAALMSRESRTERAREFGSRLARYVQRDKDLSLLLMEYWVRAMREPALKPRFRKTRERVHALLAEQVEMIAPNSGERGIDGHQMAVLITALTHGLAMVEAMTPGTVSGKLLADVTARLLG